MARKQAAAKIPVGTAVTICEGVTIPEFPDVSCSGWKGRIVDHTGSGAKLRYVIEWTDETLQQMPEEYRLECEAKNLLYSMACFTAPELQADDPSSSDGST